MLHSKALRASGALVCVLLASALLAGCAPAENKVVEQPQAGPLGTMAQPGALQGVKSNAASAVDKANAATQQTLDQQQSTGEVPTQ
jgi:hypothetical protein